jgi:hypothetical protein
MVIITLSQRSHPMELALYVERIPILTVEGEHLRVYVEISEANAVTLYATLYRLLAQTTHAEPTS